MTMARRAFLLAGPAALAAARLGAAQATAQWALLSDTHVPADPSDSYRGFRPFDNLKRAVADVLETSVDGALIDGDLARQRGTTGEYLSFRQLIAPLVQRTPVALGLGNHDDRESFLAAVNDRAGEAQAIEGKQVTVVNSGPVRLILLDSLFVAGHVPGLLGKAQRSWLDAYLRRNESTPTLLFVHHTLDDADGSLLDSDRFLRIAAAHRNVKAVFYGHSHAYRTDVLDGMHLVNLPAVGYNFADDQPIGWVAARFAKDGCELRLHAMGGERGQDGKIKSLAWRG